jgi:hypothetical protein
MYVEPPEYLQIMSAGLLRSRFTVTVVVTVTGITLMPVR